MHGETIEGPLPKVEIRSIIRGRDRALWLATYEGLFRIRDGGLRASDERRADFQSVSLRARGCGRNHLAGNEAPPYQRNGNLSASGRRLIAMLQHHPANSIRKEPDGSSRPQEPAIGGMWLV